MSAPRSSSLATSSPDAGFRARRVVQERIEHLARSAARAGYRVYRAADGFEAAIPEHLIERLPLWGKQAAPNECCALLAGRVYEDERGRHVVIVGVVLDPEAAAEHSFVQTTPASEWKTRLAARQLYPDAVIVGWAHWHVRHGILYSEIDRRNQATWAAPHAIGIVVDPWHPDLLSVYRGPHSERLTLVESEGGGPHATRDAREADETSAREVAAADATTGGPGAGQTAAAPSLSAGAPVEPLAPARSPPSAPTLMGRGVSIIAAVLGSILLLSLANVALVARAMERSARRESELVERVVHLERDLDELVAFVALSEVASDNLADEFVDVGAEP